MNGRECISRRRMLAALAILPFSGLLGRAAQSSPMKPSTLVLVHGAWHGGWCWTKLVPLLRAAGHQVFSPTLTGLGERSHLLSAEVNLTTHIKDIAAVLEYEDLHNVMLVGHSYGGMVITGVAGVASTRLAHLVYLDAFLPENGKALKDYAPLPPTRDDGWRVPPVNDPVGWGVTDERDIAWMKPRLGDQPYKTFTEPVYLSANKNSSLTRTFIQCTKASFFAEAADRARQQGFRAREMFSAGHDAMITQPNKLAKILLGLI